MVVENGGKTQEKNIEKTYITVWLMVCWKKNDMLDREGVKKIVFGVDAIQYQLFQSGL